MITVLNLFIIKHANWLVFQTKEYVVMDMCVVLRFDFQSVVSDREKVQINVVDEFGLRELFARRDARKVD